MHTGERRTAARQDGWDGLLCWGELRNGVQRRRGAAEQLWRGLCGERGRRVGDAV